MSATTEPACRYCGQQYPTQRELDDHVLAAHRSDDPERSVR